ncbi:hypothetical protein [Kitasatospora sp. NPDC097643]|uniref:hypothetical protein n=1 Tax=Kitasatospora sp. NPDC097643 TaxID=3157230 RepID=UPI003316C88B
MPITLSPGVTERPVPRWALRLARALPFALLPHCLWRLPFAVDFRMGMVMPDAPPMPWWGPAYVVGLSVLTEALALLVGGLVSGWGEVFPRRLPVIGGRRVPPMAAVVPAVLGGLALVALFDLPIVRSGTFGFAEDGFSTEGWRLLATACVTPTTLWGPIVLALAWSYHHRRRPTR